MVLLVLIDYLNRLCMSQCFKCIIMYFKRNMIVNKPEPCLSTRFVFMFSLFVLVCWNKFNIF